MAATKVMNALVAADTPSADDQNEISSRDAKAKLQCMNKIEVGHLSGACPGNPFINGLARVLTQRIGDKVPIASRSQKKSSFFSPRIPSISLKNYINLYLSRFFYCSNECYVLALVYINRITKAEPTMAVCSLNVHRLVFFALLLATKFHDDERYSNRYYAKVGGLAIEEVNFLELEFFKMLDWKAFVEPKEYQFYQCLLCQASDHEGSLPTIPFDEPEAEP